MKKKKYKGRSRKHIVRRHWDMTCKVLRKGSVCMCMYVCI